MIPYRSRWQALLVRSGKARTRAAIVGFSVLASVVLVVALMPVLRPPPERWAIYLVPAIAVPLIVSPLASHLVLELAFALDAANRLDPVTGHSTRQRSGDSALIAVMR